MDFLDINDRLPLYENTFVAIRSAGLIYVDKTDFVHMIARDAKPKLLARPRRFGKSTILSTLEELFLHGVKPYDGHDSYFKGLKIEKLWHEDRTYPVIKLDFADLNDECPDVDTFRKRLCEKLDAYAQQFGIKLPANAAFPSDKLKAIANGFKLRSLVLLIDEYDAPLLGHLESDTERKKAIAIIKGIFSATKIYKSNFRCIFFTGITRFRDLDLGTAANNTADITTKILWSGICGYTREEIKENFYPYLVYAASVNFGITQDQVADEDIESLLDKMALYYDGYVFDENYTQKVFSTWSVLSFFNNPAAPFNPYWAIEESAGLPLLLKSVLSQIDVQIVLDKLNEGRIRLDLGDFVNGSFLPENFNLFAVLFEVGYLTFAESVYESGYVYLDCPNIEIRQGFSNLISRKLYDMGSRFNAGFTKTAKAALTSLDEKKIAEYLNDLFATLPYHNYPVEQESMVSALVNFNLRGAGFTVKSEVVESLGRVDAVIQILDPDITLVFEYKVEKSANPEKLDAKLAEAVTQLISRDYGNNADVKGQLARFALVFCTDKDTRRFLRVKRVD